MSKPQRYDWTEPGERPHSDGPFYSSKDIDPLLARVEALEECAKALRHIQDNGYGPGGPCPQAAIDALDATHEEQS